MKINVPLVIKKFKGVPSMVEGLRGMGFDVTEKAVEKWRERGSIPMDRWIELMQLAKERRLKLTLEAYLIR